ncbi:MAG: FKBP-type peptidyl-prolyl cis-trans isomerase [Bacteroidota bacterium]|jgi:FKBP-type peptidyl-prolyl cis-trans isomerase FkpA
MIRIAFLFILSIAICGCKTYSDEDKRSFDKQIREYLSTKKRSFKRSSSGLYYEILDQGYGKDILYTDKVTFTYKGYFLNGDVFDEQKKPVEFEVRHLIGAWKEAMVLLKPGGKIHMIAPPQLCYGERDLDDIPPNSILVYELEVTGVE